MREKLIQFIKEKDPKLANHIVFASYGGSHLHGTNGEGSDYDLRAVAVMDEDYILGIHEFDMSKFDSGSQGLTSAGDLDAEIYHYDSFIKRIVSGEANVVDMLYAPKEKIIMMEPIFRPVWEHRNLFLSKNLLRHYKGLIFRHYQQAQSDIKKLKKPEKIQRIEKYGYDTKEIMKTVMYLRISIEFLDTHQLNLFREDREELLQMKEGALGSFEEADKYIQELIKKRDIAHEKSILPKQPDRKRINEFMKEYRRLILHHIGVI